MSAIPLWLNRDGLITFPGNGDPERGSRNARTRWKKKLVGFSSSLKSPFRISREGTVAVLSWSCRKRINSWLTKKKSLSRPVLNVLGMNTVQQMVYHGCLKRRGGGCI